MRASHNSRCSQPYESPRKNYIQNSDVNSPSSVPAPASPVGIMCSLAYSRLPSSDDGGGTTVIVGACTPNQPGSLTLRHRQIVLMQGVERLR
jgi:hypothetical protein